MLLLCEIVYFNLEPLYIVLCECDSINKEQFFDKKNLLNYII